MMGWYVRNKSDEVAVLPDGREVEAGAAVDVVPKDAVVAIRGASETWERIAPSDPDYKPKDER